MALIRPFVPARNFAVSKAFYEAIGFAKDYEDEQLAIFSWEGAGLLLQNYYVREWAENSMHQLFVTGLDTWWTRTEGLVERFGIRAPVAPAETPWGLRVGHLFDPAGVLWQVSEPIDA
jgi:hypothetical protein